VSQSKPNKPKRPYIRKQGTSLQRYKSGKQNVKPVYQHRLPVPKFSEEEYEKHSAVVKKANDEGFKWFVGQYEQKYMEKRRLERVIEREKIVIGRQKEAISELRREKDIQAQAYDKDTKHFKKQSNTKSVLALAGTTVIGLGFVFVLTTPSYGYTLAIIGFALVLLSIFFPS